MCGIFGFNWSDDQYLRKAVKKTAHRGPDATGFYNNGRVSLGHNRLSIIDLSKAGKQPMSNESGDIWIVFNGEIYNYLDLKKLLKKRHEFKSNTDTEILLHLYEESGTEILNKLQGMFAFCIYDLRKKRLFLARDRAGKKPLYYYNIKDKFIFASEIKAILEDKDIKRTVDLHALQSYLTFRANTIDKTLFSGIRKLMPGHYLIYNLKENKLALGKYWDLKENNEMVNFNYAEKELKRLLEDSVKCRLRSDVPYGAYLSGGVDSGTIVALMNKFVSVPIKTFSVGFNIEKYSELSEARFLAEKIGTDHKELVIDDKSLKYLPEIVYQGDEPMSDPTAIPTYLLSKFTKKYCTVILTGEGADELFAGYPQYKFMKAHYYFVRPLPRIARKSIFLTIKKTPDSILNKAFRFSSALGEKGKERFKNFLLSNSFSEQYLNQVAIFNQEEKKDLLLSNIKKEDYCKNYEKKYFSSLRADNLIKKCALLDFKEPMVDDLLMKIDKNTMAFSIEARAPFLDYRIIELSAKIPDDLKLNGFTKDKFILRRVAKDLIPKETMHRKKKHFFVPIESWCEKELSSLRDDLLSTNYLNKQGIFNPEYIKKINRGFNNSKLFYSRQLWSLLVFQIWHKQYIENEKVKI
ncbi:asparagine synthase (glutamine-hydrolyzing) [Candidatus Pacearchaeota archaeon]|nr:asparagine synthase (glutamine-hydrolyzing) [Candidatus Pacearchaeota archaeon]